MGKREKELYRNITSVILIVAVLAYGYIAKSRIEGTAEAENVSQPTETIEVENDKQADNTTEVENILQADKTIDISQVPEYSESPYVEINNNNPNFEEKDYTTEAFEKYSKWDVLGRSGVAYANLCEETMPKKGEKRGDISSVDNLSGWIQKRYDGIIKDKYLYNRCHLIGWQLSAENANAENLIAGTRYLNTEGMLPFENEVADYLKSNKGKHVLYRVTPVYEGENKLASGVEMEALSVEDKGESVKFNVYCYNVQPGIAIDYATGESHI